MYSSLKTLMEAAIRLINENGILAKLFDPLNVATCMSSSSTLIASISI